jgi:hypothetical protein
MSTLSEIIRDELFAQPLEVTLASLRDAGLLPSETRAVTWQQDQQAMEPAAGAVFATLSPQVPFSAQGSLFAQNIDSYAAGTSPAISMSSASGRRTGVVYNDFRGLGGSSQCLALIKVSVDQPNSLTIGGTGNPTQLIVAGSATAGTVSVGFTLTASEDGTAALYVLPSRVGMSGFWLSTSLHVL